MWIEIVYFSMAFSLLNIMLFMIIGIRYHVSKIYYILTNKNINLVGKDISLAEGTQKFNDSSYSKSLLIFIFKIYCPIVNIKLADELFNLVFLNNKEFLETFMRQ